MLDFLFRLFFSALIYLVGDNIIRELKQIIDVKQSIL